MTPRRALRFAGIQKTTLIDYPGEVACTLFVAGCNFRCPYCYNPDLILEKDAGAGISETEAIGFLNERKGFLDGVCITGGEPMIWHAELLPFLKDVKRLGLKVKLDTNGSYPDEVRSLLEAGVIDYVAIDIKASRRRYAEMAGAEVDVEKIEKSVSIVKAHGVDFECRTTVHSGFKKGDFSEIREWLSGGPKYFLQKVKLDVPILDKNFSSGHSPPGREDLEEYAAELSKSFVEVVVRE